jgi:pseudouridine synthase
MRLHKYLADCGIASRRKAEELILQGKVKVNGLAVLSLGSCVFPDKDKVEFNGKLIKPRPKKIYLKLYKPAGYVSSCARQKGEKTVLDLIPNVTERLYPVGRLDKDSEGLMILTNDGEFANKMMHPRYTHEKQYVVSTKQQIPNNKLEQLAAGIVIEGRTILPAKVKKLGDKQFSIILKEGKKRQIRRMVEAVGNRVVRLKRIRIGDITIGNLKPGQAQNI